MVLQSGRYDWQPIVMAPFDGDLELAVVDRDSVAALVLASETQQRVEVHPTHWRHWWEK
jgi:hypothetical protein